MDEEAGNVILSANVQFCSGLGLSFHKFLLSVSHIS